MKICTALAAAAAVALVAGSAFAGGTWTEVGDAPDGPATRQDTSGSGPLTSISGRIDRPGGDHVDTYSIRITDVARFYASTKNFLGGSAIRSTGGNADTRLWLWSSAGSMLLGNDDTNAIGADGIGSLISSPNTFVALSGGDLVNATAANISLVAGQKYLLSISEFANDPKDAANVDLVDLGATFDALHGPNPNAGAFDRWENAADSTAFNYTIALDGATFCMDTGTVIPLPTPALLGSVGLMGIFSMRRRH